MAVAPPPPPPPPAPKAAGAPQLKVEAGPGTNIRFGLLVQPQFEAASSATADGYSMNLFSRRTRVLIGGSIAGAFDYFFDTDFPNLAKGSSTTTTTTNAMTMATTTTASAAKAIPGMNIQDIFVTWKSMGDPFKVDVGYMLPPLSHNEVQGAGTLFGLDYFGNSFLYGNAIGQSTVNPIGRDFGVQLRGLVAGGMLEYRVGAFQGVRSAYRLDDTGKIIEVNAKNAPRVAARLQLNLLDAETGFFYSGTYLGKKKIFSIGGSFDYQSNPIAGGSSSDAYYIYDADAFVDLPAGPGVVTAQVDFLGMHGGAVVANLAKNAVMAEAGYTIADIKISPIARYERRWGGTTTAGADILAETRVGGGIAFWPLDHTANVKVFYMNTKVENAAKSVNQVNVQLQLYYF